MLLGSTSLVIISLSVHWPWQMRRKKYLQYIYFTLKLHNIKEIPLGMEPRASWLHGSSANHQILFTFRRSSIRPFLASPVPTWPWIFIAIDIWIIGPSVGKKHLQTKNLLVENWIWINSRCDDRLFANFWKTTISVEMMILMLDVLNESWVY